MNFRNLSAWSIRNPVVPMVFFIAVFLAGILSFNRMDIVNNPEVDFPGVQINIVQPGAAPTEIINQITDRVEASIRSINGVKTINSTASEGSSSSFVEFEIGTDADQAVAEVKNAVDQIRGSLPAGILEPRISKVNIAGGAFLGIFSAEATDMTIEELSWFVDDTIAKRLLAIDGMAEVDRGGGVDREIRVILSPSKMQALGVSASQVNNILRQININAAGGRSEIGGTRQSVRVLGNKNSAYELSQTTIPIAGGSTVKLSDIATITDAFGERRSINTLRGKEVVNFNFSRARGASDVTVYDEAVEVLAEIEKENPGIKFTKLFTTVDYTKTQYSSSMKAMIEGAFLAVVIVFFFLRDWRATIISAVAIPLSAIPTFWFMDLLGFNLNFLSLLALSLVAGVLVDDAIVEIENIVRHMRMGKSAYQASIDAADEIGLAVVATSFCIVAVFLPVGLMPGISGQFFKNFGITVVISVLMSLAVARMITPLMAAYFLKAKGHAEHGKGPMIDFYTKVLKWTLDNSNSLRLRNALPKTPTKLWYHLVSILLGAAIVLSAAIYIFFPIISAAYTLITTLDVSAFEAVERAYKENEAGISLPAEPDSTSEKEKPSVGSFFMNIIFGLLGIYLIGTLVKFLFGVILGAIAGFDMNYFTQRTQYVAVKARLLDHRVWMMGVGLAAFALTIVLFLNTPGQFQPTINENNSRVQIEMVPGTTIQETQEVASKVTAIMEAQPEVKTALQNVREGAATIFMTLHEDREKTSVEFEKDLNDELQQIPDARVRFQSQSGGNGTGRDLSIMLTGSDSDLLKETAVKVAEEMKSLKTIKAPRVNADLQRPEILITPRSDLASELGVTTAALSQTIRIATLGEIDQNTAKFSLSDRQIPIRVVLDEDSRQDINTINNLPVQMSNGASVPLGTVAEIGFGSGPTAIQRYNQTRRIFIGADLADGIASGEARAQIDQLPIMQNLPSGISTRPFGDAEWQLELLENFIIALISGVLAVFAVLVLLYKRLMSPLVNMCSLALAPLGGIALIWAVGQPVSMPVLIGVLMLLGIVSKNSILLIDFAIEEIARGTDKYAAIIEAGQKRAQPIVMTTVAMTAGMVPTAISLSGDSAWRSPMGIVVIGGLIVSTLLTLLIVPAGFSLADGVEKRTGPWLRKKLLTYKPGDQDSNNEKPMDMDPNIQPAE